jgi:hypothetical protein
MLKSILIFAAPFILSLVIAGAIRAFGGAERGARAANVAVMIAFIACWGFFLRPGWVPMDDFSRIGHIAFWTAFVGLALDLLSPNRLLAAGAAAIVILVSTWASATGALAISEPLTLSLALTVAVLAAAAFLVIVRLDVSRLRGITLLVLIATAALALSFISRVVASPDLAATGVILALSVAGFAVLQGVALVPVGDSVILGGGATMLALVWALAQTHPEIRLALALIPLILFAEGTARRVPLPKARISAYLYPLVLVGIAALPLALAVLVAYVLAKA